MASSLFFAIPALAVTTSVVALWVVGRFERGTASGTQKIDIPRSESQSFLFHDDGLVDHDVSMAGLGGQAIASTRNWADLRAWFGRRFGALPDSLTSLGTGEAVTLAAQDHTPAKLNLRAHGAAYRVTLDHAPAPGPADWHEALRQLDMADWKTDALNHAPCAVWITCKDGNPAWQNDVFRSYCTTKSEALIKTAIVNETEKESRPQRVAIEDGVGATNFYEVQSAARDHCNVHFATNVTAVVEAETVRREFVQTLTKTFANLTTGLAVFNRARELALFNPALVDLTMLPVEFLSGRPSLLSFFDHLRDHQVMPEPKSYPDWRAMINQMIETASGGVYSETWSLPNGLTYRVTGRPHPDGAVAFLFEDISDEVSSNRRFRAQLDLRQSVFDRLNEAIAVIGPNRSLVFWNTPLVTLLNIDPDNSFAEMSFDDLLKSCRTALPNPTFWNKAANAMSREGRAPLVGQASDPAGESYRCRLVSLPGETTMLSISRQTEPATPKVDPAL